MSCPISQLPWQAVASDCFELEEEHYAVLVDLYSDFIEVAHLPDMSTKTLIQQMKPILATHGTPALLITDNGTNYSSQEFKEFTQAWNINYITTSPHYPKSNGKAESAVKIIKGIISKAKKEGMDMWKCILEWRNSPTPGTSSSPSQRLISRRTRSMLLCSQTMYKPEVQTTVTEQIIRKRKQAKYYHDRQAKSLPKLVIGQPVRVKAYLQQPRSSWRPGTVESITPAPRSYIVKVEVSQKPHTHQRLLCVEAKPIVDKGGNIADRINPIQSSEATSATLQQCTSLATGYRQERRCRRTRASTTEDEIRTSY